MVVGRIPILRGGLAALSSLSRGHLHRAAHDTAAAFIQVSQLERREVPRTEVIALYNLGSDLYSSLFIRSEPRGPAHARAWMPGGGT